MAHRDLHPTDVDGCFGCHVLSLNVGAGALENKGAPVREMSAKDKALDVDREAYQRLRRDGLQPNQVGGSRELERRVTSQFDIDLGHIIPKSEQSRVQEGMDMARDMGLRT